MNSGAPLEGTRPIWRAPVLRRVLALVVDRILLLGLGLAFLALAGERIRGLSFLWPFLGAAAAWLYLAASYTRWANGQTVGKRLLGIQVRSAQGGWIPLWAVAVRALAVLPLMGAEVHLWSFGLPGQSLSDLMAAPSSAVPLAPAVIMYVIGTGILALSILAACRWLVGLLPGRDALGGHDILAGSVVVRCVREGSAVTPVNHLPRSARPAPRLRHTIWLFGMWALGAAVSVFLLLRFSGPDLRAAADAVAALPHIDDAVVARRYAYDVVGRGATRTTISGVGLLITVRMDPRAEGSQAAVRLDAIISRCLEAIRSIDPKKADAVKSVVVVIADPADVWTARLGDQMQFEFDLPLEAHPPGGE